MKGRIPEHFINDLLARVDIYEVIAPRVELKRAGREWRGLSPFNDERTPSFFVNQAKQMFFDFSSGVNGNAIRFLMEYERLDFVEAIEELARLAGVEVPREAGRGPSRAQLEGPLEALAEAQRVFRAQLQRSEAALAYLRRRGIDDDTAERFGIGLAPDAWDTLASRFRDPRNALAAGLLIARDDDPSRGCYDRFRNRLMFPIRDTRGRVIAFGGRTLGDDQAKYLNSPETELFHKGGQLYGLYEARQSVPHPPQLVVVEGYMDVVGLSQHGVHTAVATLGTATTADHLKLLFRATQRVVFCFDGDAAGKRAAWKGLEQALPLLGAGREVRFMFLPAEHDPDSLVREGGAAAWEEACQAAMPLSRFLVDSLAAQCDTSALDGRMRVAALVAPYLGKLQDPLVRTEFLRALVPVTRLSEDELERAMSRSAAASGGASSSSRGAAPLSSQRKPVGRALQLLLDDPQLAQRVGDLGELSASAMPGMDLLVAVVDQLVEEPDTNAARLIQGWPDADQARLLERLAMPAAGPETQDAAAEFDEIIHRLRGRSRRMRVQALLDASRERPLSTAETSELRTLTAARAGAVEEQPER